MVKRPESHRIDSLASRKILTTLSENWIFRNLTERDYGIDGMAEYFAGADPTGLIAFFQLKGTAKSITVKNGVVRFKLAKRTVQYSECFSVPFFLIVCSIVKNETSVYYLWLQRYIAFRLNQQFPHWRNEDDDKEFSLEIPARNKLPEDEVRFLALCRTPRMLAEYPQFLESLQQWELHLRAALDGDANGARMCIKVLKKISALKDALASEHAHFNAEDLRSGIASLEDVLATGKAEQTSRDALISLTQNFEFFKEGIFWPSFEGFKHQMTGEAPY